jgi:hypothetical protein
MLQGAGGQALKVKTILIALPPIKLPSAAFANVIFPALILSDRLLAWWIIGATILIEAGFVMAAFRLTKLNALFASLAANAASAVVGLLTLPYLGFYTEIAINNAGLTTEMGWAFSPQDWAVAFLIGLAPLRLWAQAWNASGRADHGRQYHHHRHGAAQHRVHPLSPLLTPPSAK